MQPGSQTALEMATTASRESSPKQTSASMLTVMHQPTVDAACTYFPTFTKAVLTACRCGQDGHFARDCPDKPANSGECFNCGETGHNKAECPNPRVEREFTGNCNICAQTGHRAADCPDKGPTVCKLCKNEGERAPLLLNVLRSPWADLK